MPRGGARGGARGRGGGGRGRFAGPTASTSTRSGGKHTYSLEERRAFTNHINQMLEGANELSSILPLNPESDDIFNVLRDGVVLWYGDMWGFDGIFEIFFFLVN